MGICTEDDEVVVEKEESVEVEREVRKEPSLVRPSPLIDHTRIPFPKRVKKKNSLRNTGIS